MAAKKKAARKIVAKKKVTKKKSPKKLDMRITVDQLNLLHVTATKVMHMEMQFGDTIHNIEAQFRGIIQGAIEMLVKYNPPDADFVSKRLEALEAQMKDVRAKLEELSPTLS